MADRNPEIDSAVRAYLNRLALRYLPMMAALTALLLVLVLVPSKAPGDEDALGISEGAAPTVSGDLPTEPGEARPPDTAAGPATGEAPGAATAAAASEGPPGDGGTSAAGAPPAAVKPGTGTTNAGSACKPGVRQVPWSAYAPQCVPAFRGSNGGATAHGVTATTITLTYRRSNSASDAAFAQSNPGALVTDEVYLADLKRYLELFNESIELYGRKVVIKEFNGQGDYIAEHAGQNTGGAQADAATARSLGAFGDIANAVKMTEPYATALAQERVIAFNTLNLPQSFYQRLRPYQYSYLPSGDKAADWYINLICQRMKGLPAIYAGGAEKDKARAFGMASPDSGNYKLLNDQIERGLNACGVKLAKRVNFSSSDPASYAQQTANLISQMQSAGVTSLICFCAAGSLGTATDQAQTQNYHPEWLVPNVGDPSARNMNQDQWVHSIVPGDWYFITSKPRKESEAYKVFKLASKGAEPRGTYYTMAYYSLLQIFGALQTAGPNLTPVSFEQGMFNMLPGKGDNGTWGFGGGAYTPGVDSQVMFWDPKATSNFDGRPGRYKACDSGVYFPFADSKRWGTSGTQIRCYGRT